MKLENMKFLTIYLSTLMKGRKVPNGGGANKKNQSYYKKYLHKRESLPSLKISINKIYKH